MISNTAGLLPPSSKILNLCRMNTRKIKRTKGYPVKSGETGMDITIGILSWKSPKTLENTLNSYKKNRLFDIVKPLMYIQQRTPHHDRVVKGYGIEDVLGGPKNTGIVNALIELLEHTTTKYFIFAECDFELVHTFATTKKILKEAIQLIETEDVQIVRLRDKKNPGSPLYSRQFAPVSDEELPNYSFDTSFPYKIEVVMFPGDIRPDKAFPGLFEAIEYETTWFKTSWEHAPWSNNIFIANTQFLKDKLLPLLKKNRRVSTKAMETFITDKLKAYSVAAGDGLFSHNRLDR